MPDGSFSPDREGKPGMWIKRVVDGRVESRLCPASGRLEEILAQADHVVEDPGVGRARLENPDDLPGEGWHQVKPHRVTEQRRGCSFILSDTFGSHGVVE